MPALILAAVVGGCGGTTASCDPCACTLASERPLSDPSAETELGFSPEALLRLIEGPHVVTAHHVEEEISAAKTISFAFDDVIASIREHDPHLSQPECRSGPFLWVQAAVTTREVDGWFEGAGAEAFIAQQATLSDITSGVLQDGTSGRITIQPSAALADELLADLEDCDTEALLGLGDSRDPLTEALASLGVQASCPDARISRALYWIYLDSSG